MAGLSFVTLLAYDWKYAFDAIRSYYAIADEIILGLDADRISFSKKPFSFDDAAVADLIAEIDQDKKIRLIEGNFHAHDVAMENDTAERRQLGAACRAGNWVVQIDADEILLNPRELKAFLPNLKLDIAVAATWIPVYKIIGDKALIVSGIPETTPIATRHPRHFRVGRFTGQPYTMSTVRLLHLYCCRTEEELVQKLTNWSHSHQVDVARTVGLWRATTLENYHQRRNFHPFNGPLWQYLEVIDWPPKFLVDPHDLDPQAGGDVVRKLLDRPVIFYAKDDRGSVIVSFGATSDGAAPAAN